MSSKETSAEFADRLNTMITHGVATMACSMGSQKGFFEKIAQFEDTFSPEELAVKCHSKTPVIRHWLLALTASDIIEMPSDDLFRLPQHRREAVLSPMSPIHSKAKFVSAFGRMEPELMDFMDRDYDKAVQTFFRTMVYEDRKRGLVSQIPAIVDDVPSLHQKLETGITVLDIGSNKGDLLFILASKYPKSTFIGVDPANPDTELAVKRAAEKGLTNVQFLVEDALKMPAEWTEKFDYIITINTLHHLPDGVRGCAEMKRILKPDGYLSIIELRKEDTEEANMSQPGAAMFYLFNIAAMSMGHRHDKKEDKVKVTQGGDLRTGRGETTGGDHSMNTLSLLTGFIKDGGFTRINRTEAPRSDFLDQVHFLCQK
ncbi:hypothetical protein CAPTEDRAFT_154856 [Capitella teleta]|uniref:Methyltransferase domain-containing protein n=1 Tax=Capitella teleta TaxID=283909 RepID=R7V4I8_CAPTE|nr:hypothetical protein CAPTEDRAFT_154856 [Capitella teleta]|eukprot:ELU11271.1 hypothetical protein CAPTEDRAFT_154856 [Capitella teleta]